MTDPDVLSIRALLVSAQAAITTAKSLATDCEAYCDCAFCWPLRIALTDVTEALDESKGLSE